MSNYHDEANKESDIDKHFSHDYFIHIFMHFLLY